MRIAFFLSLALVYGCASNTSVGKVYYDAGKTELAALYFGNAYLEEPDSPEVVLQLSDAVKLAKRNLDSAYDKAIDVKDYKGAFGIALRKEELLMWADELLKESLYSNQILAQVTQARALAMKQTLRAVDEAESKNTNPSERLKLLREAMALYPDHPEINDRYHRLLAKLKRSIRLEPRCGYRDQEVCAAIVQRIGERLTEARRELFTLVPQNSPQVDAKLVITLSEKQSDTGWRRGLSGQASHDIPKYNHFKEVKKNSKGKTEKVEVKASYSTFKRKTSATITLHVRINDLRANQGPLFVGKKKESKSASAGYYQFSGDERALSGTLGVTSLGTNQKEPTPTNVLLRQAWKSAADSLAKQIITSLEKS